MDKLIDDYFNSLNIEKPLKFGLMKFHPITKNYTTLLNYISLKKAVQKKCIELKEIDKIGSVSEIIAINNSNKKIFIWDGEVLVGGKQNRSPDCSIILKEHSQTVIPVSCIEQGRWKRKYEIFNVSNSSIPIFLRYIRNKSVDECLRISNEFKSNQNLLWHSIDDLSNHFRQKNSTLNLDEIIKNIENQNNSNLEQINFDNKYCGIIVSINDKIFGMEYISRPTVFKDLFNRVLKSYAFLLYYNNFHSNKNNLPKSISEFFNDIKDIRTKKFKSKGLGNDYRFSRPDVYGSMLIYKKSIIHISIGYILK